MNEKYLKVTAKSFKKDIKRLFKRGYSLSEIENVIEMLACGRFLPKEYRDHPLSGDYAGKRCCHVSDDWVLIYEKTDDRLFLYRTGTHRDVFSNY